MPARYSREDMKARVHLSSSCGRRAGRWVGGGAAKRGGGSPSTWLRAICLWMAWKGFLPADSATKNMLPEMPSMLGLCAGTLSWCRLSLQAAVLAASPFAVSSISTDAISAMVQEQIRLACNVRIFPMSYQAFSASLLCHFHAKGTV